MRIKEVVGVIDIFIDPHIFSVMSCVNLLCECIYLSTIVRFVTAKKIGFSRMIVSPAASNCISARRE